MLFHPPFLLLLGQDAGALCSLARILAISCKVETQDLNGLPLFLPNRLDGVILSARGLEDDDLMRLAAESLRPVLSRGLPLLAIVDDPHAVGGVRARVLGASAVLESGTPPRSLISAVKRLLRIRATPMRGIQDAVEKVALNVAELMQAAAHGEAPEPELARSAAAHMAQAIAADGATRWLNTVRTIHDPTYRHSLMVAGLMGGFAQALHFPDRDTDRLILGGLLHDVGKAMIPAEIIDRPGRLSASELALMQQHARLGHELLAARQNYDPMVLSIVRSHHEYLDGTGYPDGLRGAEISDAVRIATLCDIFAALIEARSYKPALTSGQASAQMALMTGRLDDDLLRAFEGVFVGATAARA